MSKTRTQLANRALEKLRIPGLGQSPEAEDTLKVDALIDSFQEFLSEAKIYTIADIEEIDEAPFEFLADMLSWFAAPDFFKPRDPTVFQIAEIALQRILAREPTYEPLAVDSF